MNTPFLPPGVKVLQVSELTQAIKGVLEEGFANFWVAGEITGCKRHESGHVYLCLKDERAQIKGVLWRSVVPRLRFEAKNGLAVVARGRLDESDRGGRPRYARGAGRALAGRGSRRISGPRPR